uniref:Secreted protein n=1 Tax=Triticum urartu TaxID=4572 RepID=A0A8R7TM46_TRIUA
MQRGCVGLLLALHALQLPPQLIFLAVRRIIVAHLLRFHGMDLLDLHGPALHIERLLELRIGLIGHLLGALQFLQNLALLFFLLHQLTHGLLERLLDGIKLRLQLLGRLGGLRLGRWLPSLPLLLQANQTTKIPLKLKQEACFVHHKQRRNRAYLCRRRGGGGDPGWGGALGRLAVGGPGGLVG